MAIGLPTLVNDTYTPINFVVFNNQLFFVANGGSTQQQLWKSDGTSAGTVAVKSDFVQNVPEEGIFGLCATNSQLFFLQRRRVGNTTVGDLFASDGTNAGTRLVRSEDATNFANPNLNGAVSYNNQLIFSASTPASGFEPWITDGTAAGTQLLVDAFPGTGSSNPNGYGVAGDKLYSLESSRTRISVIDLITKQRTLVSSVFDYIYDIRVVQNRVLFKAINQGEGAEWFELNGTNNTAQTLMNIRRGPAGSLGEFLFLQSSEALNSNYLFLAANDGVHGTELWYHNLNSNSSSLYTDIAPGTAFSNPDFLSIAGNTLFFSAFNKTNWQLYKIDLSQLKPVASNFNPFEPNEWLQTFGPETRTSSGYFGFTEGVRTDSKGNVYNVGRFLGSTRNLNFYTNGTTAIGNPNYFIFTYTDFLVKMDPNGQFKWLKHNGGDDFFGYIGMDIDSKDNSIVAGSASPPVVFDATVINNQQGVYVAKYDSVGNTIWYRIFESGRFSAAHHVLADSKDDIVFGGIYKNGFMRLGNVSASSLFSGQYYVAKAGSNGDPKWITNIPTYEGFQGYIKKIIADANDNYYVLTTLFAPNTRASGCITDTTYIQISKLNPNGRILWNQRFTCVGIINALAMDIDATGALSIGGYYNGAANIDGRELKLFNDPNCIATEIIQFTMNTSNGKVTALGRKKNELEILDMILNKDGTNYVLARRTSTNTSRLPGFEASPYSSAANQIVLQHRYYNGDLIAEKKWNVSSSTEFGRTYMTLDAERNFIMTTCGSQYFDTIPSSISNNNINIQTWKSINDFRTPLISSIDSRTQIKVLNNPSNNNIVISLPGVGVNGEVNIFNSLGQRVKRFNINNQLSIINIDISTLAKGVYFIDLPIGSKRETVKFLKN